MLTAGITLLVLGVLIMFGAFCYSALNMAGMFKPKGIGVDCTHQGEPLRGPRHDNFDRAWEESCRRHDDFGQSFRRHTLSMIPMALGGLMGFAGVVMIIAHFVQKAGVL